MVAPQLSPGCSTDVTKPYPQAVLSNSPLLYYRLDEASGPTACDASGNNQDGQYQAGVTFGTPGGLAGDGDAAITNPGVNVGVLQSGATLPAGNAPRTIEGWVRGTTGAPVLASYGTNVGGQWFSVYLQSGGNPYFDVVNVWTGGGGVVSFGLPHGWSDGVWHSYAVTYDGSTLAVYMDGAGMGSQTIGPLSTASPGGLQLATMTSQNFR